MPIKFSFIFLAILALAALAFLVWKKYLNNRRLLSYEFPEGWRKILSQSWPLYQQLNDKGQEKLHRQLQLFIAHTHFQPLADLNLDIRLKLMVAGPLCLLSLANPAQKLSRLLLLGPQDAFSFNPIEEKHELLVRLGENDELLQADGSPLLLEAYAQKYELAQANFLELLGTKGISLADFCRGILDQESQKEIALSFKISSFLKK